MKVHPHLELLKECTASIDIDDKKIKVYTLIRTPEQYVFYEDKKLKTKYAPVLKWLQAKPNKWEPFTLMCQNPDKLGKHAEMEAYPTLRFIHKDYTLLAFMNKDESKQVSFLAYNDEVKLGLHYFLKISAKCESFKGMCSNCGTLNAKSCACYCARFCNRACQDAFWDTHKEACKQEQDLKEVKLSERMAKMGKPGDEDKAPDEEAQAKSGKP